MTTTTLTLGPHETPVDALARQLAEAAPGDRIVYYTGPVARHAYATAARIHHEAGRCLLAQRPVTGDTRAARDFEYIAIKRRQDGGAQ